MMDKAEIENKMHNLVGIMYETGYSRGLKERKEEDQDYKDGLEDGRMEAWEAAKKIILGASGGGLTDAEIKTIFNKTFVGVLVENTATEVITKIREYEEKHIDDEIKLWDEVIIKRSSLGFEGTKGIVINTNPSEFNGLIEVLINYATSRHYKPENLEKTGKSYPELGNILD